LYVAAARRQIVRRFTQRWLQRSHQALERQFDQTAARELVTLIRGLILNQYLSNDPMSTDQVGHALARMGR
jgi:DNA-binding transcriptional regulator YbjK